MTTTTTKTRSLRGKPKEPAAKAEHQSLPPVKRRARPAWIIAALALIITASLITVSLVQSAGNTVSVLVASKPINRGETFTDSSFTTIDVAAGQPGLKGITADQARTVFGKVSTVDLPPGSLITSGAVADSLQPGEGFSIVGITLKPEQAPARPLVPGDPVRIIDTTAQNANAARGQDISGRILTTKVDSVTGATLVDITVKSSQASDVAVRASKGNAAIVVDHNTGSGS
ncbi:SAF domain-containing protein [Paenarthrobacter nicotinovorans]|uniref:SAF domain-containing protein n=1 Tax=Paenarthrobacter nicotinovorans TaxID=29320 RepID=UPI0011A1EDA9|nr:SAF domain-containing protein [Paenarthrobacter nicotinovorans]